MCFTKSWMVLSLFLRGEAVIPVSIPNFIISKLFKTFQNLLRNVAQLFPNFNNEYVYTQKNA